MAVPSWSGTSPSSSCRLIVIVLYSFGYKPPANAASSIGLDRLSFDNYSNTFSDTFNRTFIATIRIAVTGTLLCLLVGFPLAYFLATRTSPRYRGVLLGLVIVPFWTSFLLANLRLADLAVQPTVRPRPSSRTSACWASRCGCSTPGGRSSSASSTTTCP